MANKKSRLRIQLAPTAKISLRTHASTPAAVNHEKLQDGEETSMNEFSVGMILRSCLASVDAMLPEVEDHRVDTKTEIPDFNVKFKGCLAAVGATIEAVPGKDFNAKSDTSEGLAHLSDEETSQLAQNDAGDEIPVVAKRKPGRPKKVLRITSPSVCSKITEPAVESLKTQETTREKQPETPPTRALRDRSARSDAVERSAQQIATSKMENQEVEASADTKKRGASKKNATKPTSTPQPAETHSRDERKQASTAASGSEETQDEPSDVPESKRGRGRKKAVPVEEPVPDKPDEAPAGPRRGRKRTRTGSEGISEVADADVAAKAADTQLAKQNESPEGDAPNLEADDATKDSEGGLKKKRGRFRGGRSPKGESEVEPATALKTPESGVSNNESPETPAPAVTAVRKSLRGAEDSDSADTVIEETNKVKRRGRPPSTDESRSAKAHQKTVTLRGRGKKTVLKVALPIRARSTRSQAEKQGENVPAEDPVAVTRTSKFSLPPPPPPALAASRSPSPKISSPRSSARTVRVTTKKKPQRSSHASDTDTAEETLDQEEFLRQKEKLESGPIATSTPSTSHQVSTIPVHAESAKALPPTPITTTAKLDEPAGKKQKIVTVGNIASAKDAPEPVKGGLFDAAAVIVEGKRERKRKVMSEFADPNAVLELAPTTTKSQQPVVSQQPTTKPNPAVTSVTVTTTARSTPSAVTVRPMVTIVNPTMANKPNITLVPPSQQPGCSYLQSGLKPIVITVPPTRATSGSTLPGVTKTIVLPKVLARPIAQNMNQQQRQQSPSSQSTQLHHQPQIRSIRLSSSMASSPVQRSTTTIISRPPPQRVLPSPIRTSGVQTTPTSSSVVIRTIGPGTMNAPRLLTSGGIRPSIIRSPRIVTSLPGGVRPRLMSTFSSTSGARIVTVRPSVSGTTVQTIRTTVPGQPNKVFLRTVAPIIPQRHITVQATPSQPTVRTVTEPAGSRPVSAAMVIRSPPKVVVKPSEATVTKQSNTTVKKVAQQIVRPTERKAVPPPPPAKKVAVQPRKVVNVARVAPETVQPTSSVMDKLLEEPQLPKVGKKPLSKKQRSMRKTDLIKTSTRSRRRGTDLQINYNEDRLSKITDDDSDSQEDVQTSPEELGSADETQRTEENDEQEPQDDIPVAVVEVFLSQDEVKLREVHSPTKQDLVDLNRQPVEQPMEVALGGQGAPEGFFTSEEGLVETVDVPFEGAAIEAMKAGLVSTNDNAFAKSLMLGDDALLRKKVSKRKSNPLAKD